MLAGTGKPMIDWDADAAQARHVVAVGSCTALAASMPAVTTRPRPAACSSTAGNRGPAGRRLARAWRPAGDQCPGCPIHADWIVDTLMALADGALDETGLDELQRPRFYSEQLVHHGCPKNEFYEFKASAQKASDLGCLMENLGCKGTQAHADCNTRPWFGVGSCIRGGFSCIACTEPGFEDPGHPFMETPKVAGIPIGLPTDMPKAWFVALAALSKSATPKRVRDSQCGIIRCHCRRRRRRAGSDDALAGRPVQPRRGRPRSQPRHRRRSRSVRHRYRPRCIAVSRTC